jgi:hypothetical protein
MSEQLREAERVTQRGPERLCSLTISAIINYYKLGTLKPYNLLSCSSAALKSNESDMAITQMTAWLGSVHLEALGKNPFVAFLSFQETVSYDFRWHHQG